MDGNAKHDLEHTAEKTVAVSAKSTKIFTKIFGRFLIKAKRYYNKHFSSSMKLLHISTFPQLIKPLKESSFHIH